MGQGSFKKSYKVCYLNERDSEIEGNVTNTTLLHYNISFSTASVNNKDLDK